MSPIEQFICPFSYACERPSSNSKGTEVCARERDECKIEYDDDDGGSQGKVTVMTTLSRCAQLLGQKTEMRREKTKKKKRSWNWSSRDTCNYTWTYFGARTDRNALVHCSHNWTDNLPATAFFLSVITECKSFSMWAKRDRMASQAVFHQSDLNPNKKKKNHHNSGANCYECYVHILRWQQQQRHQSYDASFHCFHFFRYDLGAFNPTRKNAIIIILSFFGCDLFTFYTFRRSDVLHKRVDELIKEVVMWMRVRARSSLKTAIKCDSDEYNAKNI